MIEVNGKNVFIPGPSGTPVFEDGTEEPVGLMLMEARGDLSMCMNLSPVMRSEEVLNTTWFPPMSSGLCLIIP